MPDLTQATRHESRMKTEFTDVSETRKTLAIEIPLDVVDAEINRVARDYTKRARLPWLPAWQGAADHSSSSASGIRFSTT